MAKATTELKDLEVDRVDGVDKPATRRSFLLFKSEGGDAVMKGYGAVATAADIVLKSIRTDKHAVVSRKSAVALNGLAQVLSQDPVFVGKGFDLQPYSLVDSDLDGDKRGPADESLGPNFTAKSGPASMVGSVDFNASDEGEVSKAWPPPKDDGEDDGEDDESDKKKAKKDEASKDETSKDDRNSAAIAALAKTVEKLAETVAKAIAGPVEKAEGDEDVEKVAKARQPRSRQIEADEPVAVRKGRGDFEPRLDVSFANIAFGDKK
jgi:hypothetical protein